MLLRPNFAYYHMYSGAFGLPSPSQRNDASYQVEVYDEIVIILSEEILDRDFPRNIELVLAEHRGCIGPLV